MDPMPKPSSSFPARRPPGAHSQEPVTPFQLSKRVPMIAGLLVCVFSTLASAPVRAQSIDWWMVLPHGVEDEAGDEVRAAEQLVLALKDRRVPVMSVHQARDAFERTSREPRTLDPTDIDLLAKEAYEAVRQVAFGNRQAAARTVAQVMERAERAMETLNRETKNARYVLDACLALVRSTISRGDREGALAEAMRCRRIVPDVTPSEMMHPPSVIGVLAEADDQLRRMQIGQLTVESLPEAGCSVYLNGRHLGTTPFKLRRAAAGEYRVQVECGERPGRVHDVQLGKEPVNLRVDTLFDQAVRSQPALVLRYGSERAEKQRLLEDAQRVAKQAEAFEVVLVTSVDESTIRLRRVTRIEPRVVGDVTVAWRGSEFDPESLEKGLDALLAGRIQGRDREPKLAAATPPPQSQPPKPLPPPVRPTEPKPDLTQRQRQLRIGLPLAASGAAVLGAGWWLYVDAEDQRDRRNAVSVDAGTPMSVESFLGRSQDYENARRLPALAFAGGALGAAAMPWLLPETEGNIPPYAWVAGAAGAAFVGVGFWQLAGHDPCSTCQGSGDHLPLMSVSFASALPLLAVPVTFALRIPFSDEGSARLGAQPLAGGSAVTLSGSF